CALPILHRHAYVRARVTELYGWRASPPDTSLLRRDTARRASGRPLPRLAPGLDAPFSEEGGQRGIESIRRGQVHHVTGTKDDLQPRTGYGARDRLREAPQIGHVPFSDDHLHRNAYLAQARYRRRIRHALRIRGMTPDGAVVTAHGEDPLCSRGVLHLHQRRCSPELGGTREVACTYRIDDGRHVGKVAACEST